MATDNDRFQFQVLPRDLLKEIPKETIELFEKWLITEALLWIGWFIRYIMCVFVIRGMMDRMKFRSFSYNKHFQLYQKQSFIEVSWTEILRIRFIFDSETIQTNIRGQCGNNTATVALKLVS